MQKGFGQTPGTTGKLTQDELLAAYEAPKIMLWDKEVMRPEWKVASLLKRNKNLIIDFNGLSDLKIILTKNGKFSLAQPNSSGEGLDFLWSVFSVKKTTKEWTDYIKLLLAIDNNDSSIPETERKPEYYDLKEIDGVYENAKGETKKSVIGFEITKYDVGSKTTNNVGSIKLPKEVESNEEEVIDILE